MEHWVDRRENEIIRADLEATWSDEQREREHMARADAESQFMREHIDRWAEIAAIIAAGD